MPGRTHTPGIIHPWVFNQDRVWVDVMGKEHRLEEMSREYIMNVLDFLANNARRFQAIHHRRYKKKIRIEAKAWLEASPLVEALYKHLDNAKPEDPLDLYLKSK